MRNRTTIDTTRPVVKSFRSWRVLKYSLNNLDEYSTPKYSLATALAAAVDVNQLTNSPSEAPFNKFSATKPQRFSVISVWKRIASLVPIVVSPNLYSMVDKRPSYCGIKYICLAYSQSNDVISEPVYRSFSWRYPLWIFLPCSATAKTFVIHRRHNTF